MYTALTIAGSDSSGGAGIQADIKAMSANGVYAMSAVTALTAQNTTGVYGIQEVAPDFLANQLDCIFADIPPQAVKTGMVSGAALIQVIADKLREYKAPNVVVDPVMMATSGARLISREAVEALKEQLLPLAVLLTPNIPEAEVLSGLTVRSQEDMERAARAISERYGCAVLCKGGHQVSDANDLLWSGGGINPSGWTIPTPTEPAAPCPAPSPPIWPRGTAWSRRWSGPRTTSPALWPPCWTWAGAEGP